MGSNDYIVFADGSSRGNPGPSGIGVVVFNKRDTLNPVEKIAKPIGQATNNIAEYEAIIYALKWLKENRVQSALIKVDSALVYNQLMGNYRIKSPQMARLIRRIQILKEKIPCVSFELISRKENRLANQLAQGVAKRFARS